jgi:hypothetical protein
MRENQRVEKKYGKSPKIHEDTEFEINPKKISHNARTAGYEDDT